MRCCNTNAPLRCIKFSGRFLRHEFLNSTLTVAFGSSWILPATPAANNRNQLAINIAVNTHGCAVETTPLSRMTGRRQRALIARRNNRPISGRRLIVRCPRSQHDDVVSVRLRINDRREEPRGDGTIKARETIAGNDWSGSA